MTANHSAATGSPMQNIHKTMLSGDETVATIIDFLAYYGTPALVGKVFYQIIGDGAGEHKWERLLSATGYANDPDGFCGDLIRQLDNMTEPKQTAIQVGGVPIPHLLLMAVLEKTLPGERFTSVRSVEQLQALTGVTVLDEHHDDMQAVLDTFPVRLSSHVIRQMRVSADVAYQYLPFLEELDQIGHVNTWIGQFHQGLLEQMYQNRVIFLLNMSCPVYCRFCFRKHKESRDQTNPTKADVKKAVDYIARTPTVKEIVLTGGDPFMNRTNLGCAVDGLLKIPHVQTLRLATRSIAYYPNLFYAKNRSLMKFLKAKNSEAQLSGKRIEVATHFIHPDEVSPQSLDIITDLVNSGIAVYIQTPFLKDCNDTGPELVRLFGLLRGAGAELHYLYIPCSPIHGNSIYWTPLNRGLEVATYLRAHLSDRIIPRTCTATPIGKMDWNSSGWAIKKDPDNDHFIWLRTPYTPDYFKAFAPTANELDILSVNAEGTFDVRYMADIGDDALFIGERQPVSPKNLKTDADALARLRAQALNDQRTGRSIVHTGTPGVDRVHETRVEIDPDRFNDDFSYLKTHTKITDVVLSGEGDAVDSLPRISTIIHALRAIHHINAVRLRSFKFNSDPSRYTLGAIDLLGSLNHLTVANPLRLEIETQFFHGAEIHPEHAVLAEKLRNKGITVYNNTPLLADINDSPDCINQLAYQLRTAGIEFHHLYLAGLPIQDGHLRTAGPINVAHVIDIAGRVRKDGSGREIPRYIIATPMGEVDFGLTSKLIRKNEEIHVRLTPYNFDYFQQMDVDFRWPANGAVDDDGVPLVPVPGLMDDGGFMVF